MGIALLNPSYELTGSAKPVGAALAAMFLYPPRFAGKPDLTKAEHVGSRPTYMRAQKPRQ
jgi:hypothetical protein